MTPENVNRVFELFHAQNPTPRTELYYTNGFTLTVAVLLSAQATDKGVNKATPALFAVADTPEKMLQLGEAGVREYIKTIGLYQSKAKNIIALCERLMTVYGGILPHTLEDLQSLAGVGRKTANVVLNELYRQPTIAVDTHIFRLSHRLGWSNANHPDKVEQDLYRIIPPAYQLYAHHHLILHGRYVCKARTPLCEACFLQDFCPSFKKF